MVLTHKTVKIY